MNGVKSLLQSVGGGLTVGEFKEWKKFYNLKDQITSLKLQLTNPKLSSNEKAGIEQQIEKNEELLEDFMLPTRTLYHDFLYHYFNGNRTNSNSDAYRFLAANLPYEPFNVFLKKPFEWVSTLLKTKPEYWEIHASTNLVLDNLKVLPLETQNKFKEVANHLFKEKNIPKTEAELQAEILTKFRENGLEEELNRLSENLHRQNTFRGIMASEMNEYNLFLLQGIISGNSLFTPTNLKIQQHKMNEKIAKLNEHYRNHLEDFDNYPKYYQSKGRNHVTDEMVVEEITAMRINSYNKLREFLETPEVEKTIKIEYLT